VSGGGDENSAGRPLTIDDAKRPRRRSSKRSELELLLQLDGGTMAASAEFRKANTLRVLDNSIPTPSYPSAATSKDSDLKSPVVARLEDPEICH